MRVYQGDGIGVFTSEIQFKNEQDIMFASTVLEWFTKGSFDRLIIIDGLVASGDVTTGQLFGVGSSEAARARLRTSGIEPIQQGIVAGITGFLLGEGDRLGIDVTALLAEASPLYPDARAAALAVEAIGELTGIEIPLTELLENAQTIESSVQEVIENSRTMLPGPEIDVLDDPSRDPSVG